MAEYLPLELITEILTKLPVKSLNRFKCISKTWNSLITSSKFIKHHFHQTLISNTNKKIIITSNSSKIRISSAISDCELRVDIVNHPLNNLRHRPPVDIVESIHGLLLIFDSSKETVCLFNPSNKTQRLVPPAPSHEPGFLPFYVYADVFGFGYDVVSDDYKVVRLILLFTKVSGFYTEAYVYSMRNDCWKSVFDETSVSCNLQPSNAVAVDHTLYFLATSTDSKPLLKCFDLRTSTFSIVGFPELDSYDISKMSISLRNFRGFFCLVVNYQEHKVDPAKFIGNPHENCQLLYADVWELNESKWVKLFKIRENEIRKPCMFLRLVTYTKDMKSVLIVVEGNWYGWYDLTTKKFRRVPVQGLEAVDLPYLAYPYVESLVSAVNNKAVVSKEGTRPKKTLNKNDFLSSGFKLKL